MHIQVSVLKALGAEVVRTPTKAAFNSPGTCTMAPSTWPCQMLIIVQGRHPSACNHGYTTYSTLATNLCMEYLVYMYILSRSVLSNMLWLQDFQLEHFKLHLLRVLVLASAVNYIDVHL